MADSKITALTALTSADPANDMFPVVDVSDTTMAASGTTKRISINNILACSPSATLASATITGDLTVRTNQLIVNSSGVGVGTTPSAWSGIGPAIQVEQASLLSESSNQLYLTANGYFAGGQWNYIANASADQYYQIAGSHVWRNGTGGSPGTAIGWSTLMTLNATGLGVGVVPSAWSASFKSAQVGSRLVLTTTGSDTFFGNNFYNDGAYKFINADFATYYDQTTGKHVWGTSTTSGAVNGVITWNPAMTLDASGNLLVGTTSALASGSTFQNLGTSRQVLTLKGDAFGSYTAGVWNASTTNDGLFVYFGTEATLTVRGGISYNRGGGLVAYNTTSDYRAKDIIGPVSNSGSLIDSLKVYVGKMKGATIERPMLIAHEAQEVAPYAVTGTKDEVDAEGKPKYQQMDASALVPLLIAEIQSLRTRVQTLEAK